MPRKQFQGKAKIISVGNITSGGSGKTPTTIYLAQMLQAKGKMVAVSHRGYKGSFEKEPTLISGQKKIFDFAASAGDEAFLLASKLPGIPVVAGKNRQQAIQLVEQAYPQIDYIILDDSFQHLSVKHDYDFIVFNSIGKIGNGFLLPAGILREPLSALKYADQIIYNGAGEIPACLMKSKLPIARATYQLKKFISTAAKEISLEELQKANVALISAIGIPQSYETTINNYGIKFQKHFAFPDHYDYSDREKLKNISQENYDYIIITEKDWAKLQFVDHKLPLVIAQSEFEIDGLEWDG